MFGAVKMMIAEANSWDVFSGVVSSEFVTVLTSHTIAVDEVVAMMAIGLEI